MFFKHFNIKAGKNVMKKIIYVTGNWAKLASAKKFLEPLGFEIENVKLATTEIQADSVEEVAKYSAKEASERLKCDVLKNDTGFFIDALGGFPGVYTHYADDTIGEAGILKLIEGKENRKARFVECLAYCEYGKEPLCFLSITEGEIAFEKQGQYGWSWDFIFIPKGQSQTLGCFPDEERWPLWNMDGYAKLADYLKNL